MLIFLPTLVPTQLLAQGFEPVGAQCLLPVLTRFSPFSQVGAKEEEVKGHTEPLGAAQEGRTSVKEEARLHFSESEETLGNKERMKSIWEI